MLKILLTVEAWTQYLGLAVPDPKTNREPCPLVKADTCIECTVGSITSSAAHWPHGKCHWSIYQSSLLETAVYRPMGNPWSFIRLGLLQEPSHTAEPENATLAEMDTEAPVTCFRSIDGITLGAMLHLKFRLPIWFRKRNPVGVQFLPFVPSVWFLFKSQYMIQM